jgi:hypothetical protein
MPTSFAKRILYLSMFIALAARLPLAWKGPNLLIPKVVSDDMFYYLTIARNMAEGHGATADGEHISNGFHFLYTLLLVPLAAISGDDNDLFIHLALSMLTVFSILSAWFLFRLLHSCCSEMSALFVSILWLCAPFPVLVALNGVEAPVYVFSIGLVSLAYVKLKTSGTDSLSPWLGLGLLAALSILARLDGGILAAIIALELFIFLRRRRQAVSFCAGALAGIAPWFLWSYLRTGFILQVSGKAIRYQTHLIFSQRGGGVTDWLRQAAAQFRMGIGTVAGISGINTTTFFILCIISIALFLGLALSGRDSTREWAGRVKHVLFLPVYGLVAFLLYACWLWYTQNWYFYSVFFSGCIVLGILLDFFVMRIFAAGRVCRAVFWGILLVFTIASSIWMDMRWWRRGLFWWQAEMYNASLWCRTNLPPDARLGSFNSGIIGYYSGHHVINLDGVTNPDAYRAMLRGRSLSYIRHENIRYLVESERSLRFRALHAERDFLGSLKLIHRERLLPENNVGVYEVK